jgi:hypothetical protein
MAVHIYGLPVDIDPLLQLVEKCGIKLIEDAAARADIQWKTLWQFRRYKYLQLLSQQTHYNRREWDDSNQ